jgi:hypothetical protein
VEQESFPISTIEEAVAALHELIAEIGSTAPDAPETSVVAGSSALDG